jgi:chromosome segregation ATPase
MIGTRRRISDLFAKIKNLEVLKEYKTRDIGELISEIESVQSESTQFSLILESIAEIKKSIPEKARIIADIKKITTARDGVKQEIASIKKELAQKDKEARDTNEKIGKIAYGIFKLHSRELVQVASIFTTLKRLDEQGHGYAPKNDYEYRADKTVFNQIAGAAKSIFASYSSRSSLSRYAKAYRDAGAKIGEDNYTKAFADGGLDDLLAIARRIEKERGDLYQKGEGLLKKLDSFKDELGTLGVKASPLLRIRELSGERKRLEGNLASKYKELGELFLDNQHVLQNPSAEITKSCNEIKQILEETDEARREIERLEARIEIDAIENKIGKASSRIEQLSRTIAKSEQGIQSLRQKISELERELKKYRKIAGD